MASSYMVMSIVGGALIPLALGYISSQVNIQVAYSVPLICFFVILYYGWKGYKVKEMDTDKLVANKLEALNMEA
jgi:FHS family L-fucose permease-like MFS transporter